MLQLRSVVLLLLVLLPLAAGIVCNKKPKDRVDCGWPGIPAETCLAFAGCCFDRTIWGVIWCYYAESDPCISNPCEFDGVCHPAGVDFTCECKNRRGGKTCKIENGAVGNLASGKTVLQVNTFQNMEAVNAVDGSLSTVSCTAMSSNPWWQVDLETAVNVKSVNITFDDDPSGHGSRLKKFDVRVGNIVGTHGNDKWIESGTVCATYSVNFPLRTRVSVTCSPTPALGRYVTIQGHGDALCMKEVQVY